MAHNLEIKKDGKAAMFSVKETPWHGLSVILDNPPTIEEGIKLAGLDWTVSVRSMTAKFSIDGAELEFPATHRMVIRDSDNRRLSEVGPDWTPLQNMEAFKWFDPFISQGECTLETAGSLYDGKRIWVMAKLNRDPMEIVPGDEVNKFLMLSNSHSDERSAAVTLTPQRVVCSNTLAMAFSNTKSKFLKLRHNRNILDNLTKIREVVNTANAEFEATAEQYKALTKMNIKEEQLKKYIKLVFKKKDDEEVVEEAKAAVRQAKEDDGRKIENKIIPLFEGGRGAKLPGVAGTMYGAYQAVNEYLNWYAARTQDRRLDELWFGMGAKVNSRALEVAMDMMKQAV